MCYIRHVETTVDAKMLLTVPRKWEAFDTELYNYVISLATQELKRQLMAYQQGCFVNGFAPSGRYALWYLLRKFAVSKATSAQFDITRLIKHEAKGDLALYLDGLDIILADQDELPAEALLHSIVEPQLRTFQSLVQVFQYPTSFVMVSFCWSSM